MVSSICAAFSQYVQDCLHGEGDATLSQNGLLELLQDLVQTGASNALTKESLLATLPNTFIFAYVIPRLDTQFKPSGTESAVSLWEAAHTYTSDKLQLNVVTIIKQKLHDIVLDCNIPVRYVHSALY